METQANHLLIGSFVLALMAGLFAFPIWLTGTQSDREFAQYNIYFRGSVAGLGKGGDVRYRGIKVGSVARIRIDPQDPSRVVVTVKIDRSVPIREDDRASLEPQGITGIAYINIEGATADSPPIGVEDEAELPVILSKPSQIEQLVEGAPELIQRAIDLSEQASKLLSDRNLQLVTATLSDLNAVSRSLASRREGIERIIDALDRSSDDITASAKSIRQVVVKTERLLDEASETLVEADALMSEDFKGLIADLRRTAQSFARLANEADKIVAENQMPIREFTTEGLRAFNQVLRDARTVLATFLRLAERIESDGARFLIGDREAEFKLE